MDDRGASGLVHLCNLLRLHVAERWLSTRAGGFSVLSAVSQTEDERTELGQGIPYRTILRDFEISISALHTGDAPVRCGRVSSFPLHALDPAIPLLVLRRRGYACMGYARRSCLSLLY